MRAQICGRLFRLWVTQRGRNSSEESAGQLYPAASSSPLAVGRGGGGGRASHEGGGGRGGGEGGAAQLLLGEHVDGSPASVIVVGGACHEWLGTPGLASAFLQVVLAALIVLQTDAVSVEGLEESVRLAP